MLLFRGLSHNSILVVSGNEQPKDCNISDLIAYIEYNNGTVSTSKIHSIFDYLYEQYTDARIAYLKKTQENIRIRFRESYICLTRRYPERKYQYASFEYHLPFTTLYVDSGLFSIE